MKYRLEKIEEPGVVIRVQDFGNDTPPDISHKGLIWLEYIAPVPTLEQEKDWRRQYVNGERYRANTTSFPHAGKMIACDQLSRSDIDGVASYITLNGSLPPDFPGAWKATDNTYIPIATTQEFTDMVSSMVGQGTANFLHAQSLKAQIEAAETVEAVKAVVW